MLKLRLAFLLIAPIALAAIPTARLAAAPSICVFRNLTGHPCPGCGITRALSATLHGDFAAAWQYNPLVVVVAPLLAGIWLRQVWCDVRRLRCKPPAAPPADNPEPGENL